VREAEVLQGQGKTIAEVVKQLGVTEQTFYRWRKECGGMRVDQAIPTITASLLTCRSRRKPDIDLLAPCILHSVYPAIAQQPEKFTVVKFPIGVMVIAFTCRRN
jgi:hypothetical protein